MANIFGNLFTKKEIIERVGDISQLCGIRLFQLDDGFTKGVRCAEIRTGSGLSYHLILDRGMDIGMADFQGIPLSYRSATNEIHPAYYEPLHKGWHRGFHAGLLVSCGLSQVGAPCNDNNESLGLHGRISYIPASKISLTESWNHDDYHFEIRGEMRETQVFGENIRLIRSVSGILGKPEIHIHDTIENLGFQTVPLMYLYHFNFGFPLLDKHAELQFAKTPKVTARDQNAQSGIEHYYQYENPQPQYQEKVYFIDAVSNDNDWVSAGLVNPILNHKNGLGVIIRYHKATLPHFTQWKMLDQGLYVTALEPGNCNTLGRVKEREANRLEYLKPLEKKDYMVILQVCNSSEEFQKHLSA